MQARSTFSRQNIDHSWSIFDGNKSMKNLLQLLILRFFTKKYLFVFIQIIFFVFISRPIQGQKCAFHLYGLGDISTINTKGELGIPQPVFGISYGYSPFIDSTASMADLYSVFYFEKNIPTTQSIKLPVKLYSTQVGYEPADVSTSYYRIGGTFGIGYETKKSNRYPCISLGLYYYRYEMTYYYNGIYEPYNSSIRTISPGVYSHRESSLGFLFGLSKFYTMYKLDFQWTINMLVNITNYDREKSTSNYLETLPVMILNVGLGIRLPFGIKSLIEKVSLY